MTRRALVVDDNEFLVRTLSDILRLAGWDVTPAASGSAAVKRVMDEDYDVVLMDIKMPGINGVDAFRAMRAVRPDLRVVLMSAYTAPELIAEAEREGVLSVMTKPVNPPALLEHLDRLHREHRAVVIVDNDAAFLHTLSDLLEREGYATVVADDLAHATRLLEERRPVAILLHLHLGRASPREAVTAMHEANPRAPLIIYSGRPGAEQEVRESIPEQWIHRYLQKPFATARVADVLRGLRDSA